MGLRVERDVRCSERKHAASESTKLEVPLSAVRLACIKPGLCEQDPVEVMSSFEMMLESLQCNAFYHDERLHCQICHYRDSHATVAIGNRFMPLRGLAPDLNLNLNLPSGDLPQPPCSTTTTITLSSVHAIMKLCPPTISTSQPTNSERPSTLALETTACILHLLQDDLEFSAPRHHLYHQWLCLSGHMSITCFSLTTR